MINKRMLLLALFTLSLTATQAQLLWKVSGKGLKHPSYLFATHTMIPLAYLDSIPGLYKAFNECNIVAGEIAINNIDATANIKQAAMLPRDSTMSVLLNEADYKLVDNELKTALKIGLKQLTAMHPALIRQLYETELYKKATRQTDNTLSDSYFQLVAEKKDKKVVGLETYEQQIKHLLGKNSLKDEALQLVQTIRNKEKLANDMLQQIKLYKSGNIDKLAEMELLRNMDSGWLADDRSSGWMAQLLELFKESSCFVTVDAMQLGGKNGLIKQLEKAGYKVKAIL